MRGGGGVLANLLPWKIMVPIFTVADAVTGWTTITADSTAAWGTRRSSSGAQNDELSFDVVLAGGTWSLEFMFQSSATGGIITASLDDGAGNFTTIGTVDTYNSSTVKNNVATITAIAVGATMKRRLKLKMATKNASASSYLGSLQHLFFMRTA